MQKRPMVKGIMQKCIFCKRSGNVLLVAILLMSILTSIIVIDYHYLAMQRQVDTELTHSFLEQASHNMQSSAPNHESHHQ